MKKNKILKYWNNDDSYPKLLPSKTHIPEWYRDAKDVSKNSKNIKVLPLNLNFKACSPFLDALSSGYTVSLPVDIAVQQTDGGPSITWSESNVQHISLRQLEQNSGLPTPNGFSKNHFVWLTQISVKIPKGYSALYTHPLNRYDLPFLTLSGIVDGEFIMPPGNVPVFFSDTFEGLIPAGTPIIQILLFKQENWKSKEDKTIYNDAIKNLKVSNNTAVGWYKKNIWKRKSYE
jgi:hypothetical protein